MTGSEAAAPLDDFVRSANLAVDPETYELENDAIARDETDAWWKANGAERTDVRAAWKATSPAELERILRLEFAGDVVDEFLRTRPPTSELTYGIAIFTVRA